MSGSGDGTSQGRPTVRDVLKKNAECLYFDVLERLREISVELGRAIRYKRDATTFRELLEAWMASLAEVKVAEKEWTRCMQGAELQERLRSIGEEMVKFEEMRRDAGAYIDELLGLSEQRNESSPTASEKAVNRDIAQLGDRMQGLTNTLSDTMIVQGEPQRGPEVQQQPPLTGQRPGVNVLAPPFVPVAAANTPTSPGTALVSKLTEALSALSNKDQLPKIEPQIFKGDMLEFPMWWSAFQMIIEPQNLSNSRKLLYLNQYLSEDVRASIKWLLQLHDREDSYEMAIDALFETYGDQLKISDAYLKKLRDWPYIRANDAAGLRKYADFLFQCQAAKQQLGYLNVLDQPGENRKLAAKLPSRCADQWNRRVVKQMYPEGRPASSAAYDSYPMFNDFCEYVRQESRIASGPCVPTYRSDTHSARSHNVSSQEGRARSGNRPVSREESAQRVAQSFSTGVYQPRGGGPRRPSVTPNSRPAPYRYNAPRSTPPAEPRSQPPPLPPPPPCEPGKCRYCGGEHELQDCIEFLKLNGRDKKDVAIKNNLCFGCLGEGHSYTMCTHKNNSLLRSPQKVDAQSMNTLLKNAGNRGYYSMTLPVCVEYNGRYAYTYAMVDTQSNKCFLDEDLAAKIQVSGYDVTLEMTTMAGTSEQRSVGCRGIRVRGVNESEMVKLPVCYTRPEIPGSKRGIPRPEDLIGWPEMNVVRKEMHEYREDWGIGLLIGGNMPKVFIPKNTVEAASAPFAFKSVLGWSLIGARPGGSEPMEEEEPLYCCRTQAREVTMDQVRRVFDGEFQLGRNPDERMSQEDKRFLKEMDEGLVIKEDGHVTLPLPLKDPTGPVPDSRKLALKRLMSLGRRFKRDPKFKNRYVRQIMEMIERGWAELVPEEDMDNLRRWYLPHQGVDHPRKPDVTRVVFDGGAEICGVSLNSMLLQGPDLNNTLIGVLLRFRMKKKGFLCDIEKMFMQVYVKEGDRDMLRFLFFENGDPDGRILEYRVTVHLFGATSSPAVATYALRKTAELNESQFEPEVAEFIRRNFYVDDGLGTEETDEKMEKKMHDSRSLCAKGGFNLCKFASSSNDVNARLPEEMKAKDLAVWEIMPAEGPRQVTLGMLWSLQLDCWRYAIKPQVKALTRRGMLSTLSSIYDPLGLIGPAMLKGRNILQSLCKNGYSWDDPVPSEVAGEWVKWHSQLGALEELKIPRSYRDRVSEQHEVEYHIYGDASGEGYGGCAYILFRDLETKETDRKLVLGKSRVRPTKEVPMPRLELQAAVTAVALKEILCVELPYENVKIYFYTDSTIVLAYLFNESLKLDRFTANRVQFILDRSAKEQWRKVPTEINPADIASRGLTARDLLKSDLWWTGPGTMLTPGPPENPHPLRLTDPGVHPPKETAVSHATDVRKCWSWEEATAEVPEWPKLVACVAAWHRYLQQLRRTAKKQPREDLPLYITAEERQRAANYLVREAQRDYLPGPVEFLRGKEYAKYQDNKRELADRMRGHSNLYRLDPYLDQEGILRIGGRVKRANLPEEVKHPCIVPGGTFLSKTLIDYHHNKIGHAGVNHTMASLRSHGWWILRGRKEVARHIRDCVTCRKIRGRLLTQKMADLPYDRMEQSAPFTFCGVDLIGPMMVQNKRTQCKRWLCLFTCLVIRAVHVEVCQDLSTDAFLQAYRRFVDRRGPVRLLRSDRGTNIIGAENELKADWMALDQSRIARKLAQDGCDLEVFLPNTPRAPHMGGAWERLVGSVKNTLRSLFTAHPCRLDDWQLLTFATEAEAIVNSRPLTYVDSTDSDLPMPLSPIRLLTLKQDTVPAPPGEFPKEDLYGRRRWRRSQFMAEEFWHQWRSDYLPTLMPRKKWSEVRENVKIGDVVLVQEDSPDRSQWPLARVMDVKNSEDGLVRTVTVKTKTGTYQRPVRKLVMIYRAPEGADEVKA